MGEISAYIVAPYTRPVRTVQWEVGGLLPPVYPIAFLLDFFLGGSDGWKGVALVGDSLQVDAVGVGTQFDELDIPSLNHCVDGWP